MDQRRTLLKRYGIALAFLAAYYCIVRFTGLSIDCPFRKLTGFKCPGCGISRMLIAMSKGDLSEAFRYNQVLFFLVPALIIAAAVKVVFMPNFLAPKSKFSRISTVCAIVVLLAFGIVRNIFKF